MPGAGLGPTLTAGFSHLTAVARSVPFSLWVGSLFVATLSYYTTDYMRQGQDAPEKRNERYVYDPSAGARRPRPGPAHPDALTRNTEGWSD